MSQFFASGSQSIKSFSFSLSPSNEYSGLISFRMDWLDLLQSKRLSRVFSNTTVQNQLTKSNRELFNKLSRLVIDFLPRSKHLLNLWLQSPSEVMLEPQNIVFHHFHCCSIYCHEVVGLDAVIFTF